MYKRQDCYSAEKAREHNNANILCLGARVLGTGLAEQIVDAYLGASFLGSYHTQRVQKIMDLETTPRTKYLRTMWAELSRLHNHLMWLGLLADAFGFESLFMDCWRLREKVLDMLELTTGGRVIFSVNKVGGLKKDVTPEMLESILKTVDELERSAAL